MFKIALKKLCWFLITAPIAFFFCCGLVGFGALIFSTVYNSVEATVIARFFFAPMLVTIASIVIGVVCIAKRNDGFDLKKLTVEYCGIAETVVDA